jgi:rhodanese-related sulfurtransferase
MTITASRNHRLLLSLFCGVLAAGAPCPAQAQTPPRPSVFQTTLEEAGQATPEITTEQLRGILASNSEPVFDVRFAKEYAIAHIPGTVNVFEKEVERITELYPDRSTPMILYCNGPSCGKSKRTSEQLVALGYTGVRRYQLGLPVWRAFSETVQTDMPGVLYIHGGDRTAVWVDARTPPEFVAASIPGAVNVQKGEAVAANDDGRLPLQDKGTRVVVFGSTVQQARVVAAEIAKRAYWNSSYFGGTFDDLAAAGLINHRPIVVARNAALAADAGCLATPNARDLDNGSFDPDSGDALSLTVLPAGAFGLGQHQVALAATDRFGSSASASAFITVSDQSGPSIGGVVVRQDAQPPQRHGMTLLTIDYTATDNCGGVTTALSIARGGDDRAQVIDSHHVLVKGSHGNGKDDDDDEGRRLSLTIVATDDVGNQSERSVTIGGRAKAR